MTAILYLHERAGGGVASIPLDQVNGVAGLKLVRGQHVERYSFWGKLNECNTAPMDGDPEITLEIEDGDDYPVAHWPHVVAVTVSDMLFWRDGDRWRLDPDANASVARSQVEARYYPVGYDLPGRS